MRHTCPKSRDTSAASGFTLIEMLVVAPLVILLIGSIISVVSVLTGESLKVLSKNEKIHEVQDVLETMEFNSVRAMQGFETTTTGAPLTSPQGKNSGTAAFTSDDSTLVMQLPATNTNPLSSARSIVYRDSACTTIYLVYLIYFVDDSTLYERTVRSDGTNNGYYINGSGSCATATPWYRGSCTASGSGVCQKADEVLATNVTDFDIIYPNTQSAEITLTTSKTVAGDEQSYTSSLIITAPE